MANSLQNQFIDQSYQKVVQVSGSFIADGTGSLITNLNVTAATASYAPQLQSNDGFTIVNQDGTGAVNITPGPDFVTKFSDAAITGIAKYEGNVLSGSWGEVGNLDGLPPGVLNPNRINNDSGKIALVHGVNYRAFDSNYIQGTLNLKGDTVTVLGSSSLNSGVSFEVKGDITGSKFSGDGSGLTNLPTATSASHAIQADNATSASRADSAALADLATLATNSTYSDNTVVYGKNLSGVEIAKGTPLYFTGSGTSGNLVGVYPADASNPARMPAAGVAGEILTAPGGEGVVLLDGFINGVNTSEFNSGDTVFVAVGGGYTNQRPTGSANLVQSLGYIEKVGINGSGVIKGSGRANDIPNLQQGYFFVGGTGDVGTTVASSSFAKVGENNVFTGTQTFDNIAVNGTGSFAYIQSVTGSAKIIGDAFIVLNNDTPTERYAGIKVYDSGSAGVSASLEFDGQSNDWLYEYSDDGGVTTDHGVALFGPEYSTKGTPTYPTNNTIQKGDGGHHLLDSSITDDGALVTVSNPLTVTGTITGNVTGNLTGTATAATSASHALLADSAGSATSVAFTNITGKPTLVSGSSQIDVTATQNYVTPVDLTTNQSIAGDKTFSGYTTFSDGVQGGISPLNGTGTVSVDISAGTFFATAPSGTVTYAVTGAPMGPGITVSFIIDNSASQTVSFTGVEWPGGTAPTITAGGKDIITLVAIGGTIYGAAVQNFS